LYHIQALFSIRIASKQTSRFNPLKIIAIPLEFQTNVVDFPLPPALEVETYHRAFHVRMVNAVTSAVPPEHLYVLIQSLHAIHDYFYDQEEA